MKSRSLTKVVGKICPCCGQVGLVLYETEIRIVYECPDRHQYETRKWRREKSEAKTAFLPSGSSQAKA
jgi:hypothetical protein